MTQTTARSSDWEQSVPANERTFGYFLRGMRTLWRLTESEHRRLAYAALALVCVHLVALVPSLLFSRVVDLLPTISRPEVSTYAYWLVLIIVIAEFSSSGLHKFVQERIFIKSAWTLENELPMRAHKKLLSLSMLYHERENTGKKISSVSKGVERLMSIIADTFWGVLPEVIAITIRILVLAWLDWRFALLLALPLIPAAYVYSRQYVRFAPVWEEYEKHKDTSVGLFCQSLICIDTVQRFVQEKREASAHDKIRNHMREIDIDASVKGLSYAFAMEVFLRTGFCATLVAGIWFVQKGWSTPGDVAFAFIAGNGIIRGFTNLIQMYARIMRNLFATERMQALLDEPLDVQDVADPIVPAVRGGTLSFERVSHTYAGKSYPTVERLSLVIPQGQMVAFVGRSGAGKSTLVRLIARVCDPSEGAVCLNGTDIRHISRDWYRTGVAVVPQDVQILEGTIADNVCYGVPEARESELKSALEAACLDDMLADLSRFPNGVETQVGERGVRLSGGERQRVGIARAYIALLHGATTLILDEATASLDSQSERVVQGFIEKLRADKAITIIAIAHRLSTIQRADRIVVLENGSIIESGDHAKLLTKNGLYAQLVRLQTLGEVEKGDPATDVA